MDEVTFVEASRELAERLQITRRRQRPEGALKMEGIRLVLRAKAHCAPKPDPAAPSSATFDDQLPRGRESRFRLYPSGRNQRCPTASSTKSELAAYTGVASLILNLDETITKE